jgi:hypothetical protein
VLQANSSITSNVASFLLPVSVSFRTCTLWKMIGIGREKGGLFHLLQIAETPTSALQSFGLPSVKALVSTSVKAVSADIYANDSYCLEI